jgi:hypothetical protein
MPKKTKYAQGLTLSTTLDEQLAQWRRDHWPPNPALGFYQYSDLPLYIAPHQVVKTFAERLAELLQGLAPHIYELEHGRLPRWMAIPKVSFHVGRINILQTEGKTSRRYGTLDDLFRKLKPIFDDTTRTELYEWEATHPECTWVAHLPLTDIRAYVFHSEDTPPKRVRFMESGLIVGTQGCLPEALPLQDHRHVLRRKRQDGYGMPLAISDNGWRLFGRLPTSD